MKAYKGFNSDLTCRGFQYEVGKTYEEDTAKLCDRGFHACLDPLDCYRYYAPDTSVYYECELEDVSDEREEDSKIVGKKITLVRQIDNKEIYRRHKEYVESKCDEKKSGGDYASVSGGYKSSVSGGNFSSLSGGDWSSVSGGDYATVVTRNGKAKGGLDALLVISKSEYVNCKWRITDYACGIIDGETIKADTWYKLVDGKLVEVDE